MTTILFFKELRLNHTKAPVGMRLAWISEMGTLGEELKWMILGGLYY